jgi:hypothetical protein
VSTDGRHSGREASTYDPTSPSTIDELIECADRGMYRRKRERSGLHQLGAGGALVPGTGAST